MRSSRTGSTAGAPPYSGARSRCPPPPRITTACAAAARCQSMGGQRSASFRSWSEKTGSDSNQSEPSPKTRQIFASRGERRSSSAPRVASSNDPDGGRISDRSSPFSSTSKGGGGARGEARPSSPPFQTIPADDEQEVAGDAHREQGERCGDDLGDLVQAEPAHGRVHPLQERRDAPHVAFLHAASDQRHV